MANSQTASLSSHPFEAQSENWNTDPGRLRNPILHFTDQASITWDSALQEFILS